MQLGRKDKNTLRELYKPNKTYIKGMDCTRLWNRNKTITIKNSQKLTVYVLCEMSMDKSLSSQILTSECGDFSGKEFSLETFSHVRNTNSELRLLIATPQRQDDPSQPKPQFVNKECI